MVSQLLAFARRRIVHPQPMNLNAHLQQALDMLQQILGEDIEITYHIDPNLGTVSADPAQIEQVLVNLVSNARQAMPHGGKLTIETQNTVLDADYAERHWEVQPGEYVLIAVSDTGDGIAPEHLPRLFEPFYTMRETGTGLGLATVYGIINQAQGYIWVYSELGKGTTFKIYLPCATGSAQPLPFPHPTASIAYGTERILLVEDNPTVLTATTPEEAIQVAQAHPIDLLITDVVLPQMRGSILAQILTSVQPNLKVLYISGSTENSIIQRGELKPGVAFYRSPTH